VRLTFRAGVSDGSLTEVAEGELHEGDRVITAVTGGEADANPARQMGGGGLRRVF